MPAILLVSILFSGCAIKHYESGYTHYQLGVEYQKQNNQQGAEYEFKKAIEESSQALKTDPSLKEAYVVRGGASLYLSQKDKALQDLLVAHHLDSEAKGWVKPLAGILLGNLYYKDGADEREERGRIENELRSESDTQKKEKLRKEILEHRFKEMAYYDIALDLYKRVLEMKEVPVNIQIEALQDSLLCHHTARGAARLINDTNGVKSHTEAILDLSGKLLALDYADPVALHFIGMSKSEDPGLSSQLLALKFLLLARSMGLPEVLRYENEDRIKDVLSSLIERGGK